MIFAQSSGGFGIDKLSASSMEQRLQVSPSGSRRPFKKLARSETSASVLRFFRFSRFRDFSWDFRCDACCRLSAKFRVSAFGNREWIVSLLVVLLRRSRR